MPDIANQLTVTTRRYIDTNPELRDLVFNHDPTMSLMADDCHIQIGGGLNWNWNIEYDVQDGGPYSKGQDLPADQRQIEQAFQFQPKLNAIMIPFYKEDIKVFNVAGDPMQIVNLVTERVDAAFMQLGAQAALQRYLQGQSASNIKFPNGLLEASSDGINPGWDGNTYPVYGTLTRSLYGGRTLAPQALQFCGWRNLRAADRRDVPVRQLRFRQVRVQRHQHNSDRVRLHPKQLPDPTAVPERRCGQGRVQGPGVQRCNYSGVSLCPW